MQAARRGTGVLVTVAVLAWVIVAAIPGGRPKLLTVLGIVVGASFLGAGLVAWRHRPRNRTGMIMVAIGLAWLPERFFGIAGPLDVVIHAVSGLWAAGIAQLVLAFPTGRLGSGISRVVVGAAYFEAVAIGISKAVEHVYGAIPAHGLWQLARFFTETESTAVLVIGTAVLGLAIARWWRTSPTQRRTVTPVLATSALAIVLFVASTPLGEVDYFDVTLLIALAAIPLAYLASLMRRRIDRAGVADLVVRLSGATHPANLQEALASTLHDPSLLVGYWLAEQERYVDTEGRPLAEPASGQVVTRVDRGGSPVAVLVHDAGLLDEPELVEAACAAAGLALENERLTADLRARVRQLATSRSRVLQATEAERRRLERDLHDIVQQRLLSVAMTLGLAESTGNPEQTGPLISEAKDAVLAALGDLRAVCHGIHPPLLTERGLLGAVRELTATALVPTELAVDLPGTLAPEVESAAYFIVAEALTNITKHAAASRALVRIAPANGTLIIEVSDDGCGGADADLGTGIAGMANRVEATGGRLAVTSPPGAGTTIRAALPRLVSR